MEMGGNSLSALQNLPTSTQYSFFICSKQQSIKMTIRCFMEGYVTEHFLGLFLGQEQQSPGISTGCLATGPVL